MPALAKSALALLRVPEAKSQEDLVERMRADYQIALAERVLRSEVMSVDVTFSADGAGEEYRDHFEGLWKKHLPKMLDCIAEGRVAWEKDWEYADGVTRIVDLIPLPMGVTELKLSKVGDFTGIKVSIGDNSATIPPQSAWWLALDPDAKHPYGKSRFQGAPYQTWKERQESIRLRKLLVSKFVVRGMVGRAPASVTLENGQSIDGIANFLQQCDALLSGGSMCMPSEYDAQGRPTHEVLQFPQVSDPGPLNEHIDGLDQEQLQAFGIPPKTVLEGDSGSYAMVVAQRRVLDAVVDDILSQIENSFQLYVIDKELRANGLPAGAVKVSHEPLVSRVNQMLYDILLAIFGNPEVMSKLLAGVIDIGQVLDKLRVPMKDGAREVIERIFSQLQKSEVEKPKETPVVPESEKTA